MLKSFLGLKNLNKITKKLETKFSLYVVKKAFNLIVDHLGLVTEKQKMELGMNQSIQECGMYFTSSYII